MKEIRCPRCNMLRGKIDEDGTFHYKIYKVIEIIAQIKTLHIVCYALAKTADGGKEICGTRIFVEHKDEQCLISA